jgi:hypothetical protein
VLDLDDRARALTVPQAVATSEQMPPIWEYPDDIG